MIEYINTDIAINKKITRVIPTKKYKIDKNQYSGYMPIVGITILYVNKIGNDLIEHSSYELRIIKSDTIDDTYYFNDNNIEKIRSAPNNSFIYHGIVVNYYFFEYNNLAYNNFQYNINEYNKPTTPTKKPTKLTSNDQNYIEKLKSINTQLTNMLTSQNSRDNYDNQNNQILESSSIYYFKPNIKIKKCKITTINYDYFTPNYKLVNNYIVVKIRESSKHNNHKIFIYRNNFKKLKKTIYLPSQIASILDSPIFFNTLIALYVDSDFFYINNFSIQPYEYPNLNLDNITDSTTQIYHYRNIQYNNHIFDPQYTIHKYTNIHNVQMVPRITITNIVKFKNKYHIVLLKTPYVRDHLYFTPPIAHILNNDKIYNNSEIILITTDIFFIHNNIYKHNIFTYQYTQAQITYNIKKALNHNIPILNTQENNKSKGNKIYRTKYYTLCPVCNIELMNIHTNKKCKKCTIS